MTHKIILDTDPGIDDAMAIYFAFQHPQIEVLGLTTVYGNVPVSMSARNALTLRDYAGQNMPVCKGVAMPWVGPESGYAHFVHGDDGFGNIDLPPSTSELDPRSAAQFIVDTVRANPGEVTLVAIGPLGNLALALRLEPELPKLVKGVAIMGGAAFVPGNVSPVAEANIWNDAYAADIVFSAGWPLIMFGLDATKKVAFDQSFMDKLEQVNAKLGGLVNRASQFYMDFYSEGREPRVCYFHDSMPLAHLVAPELFELVEGHPRVATDPLNLGQTSVALPGSTMNQDWLNRPTIQVAVDVQGDALTQLYLDAYAGSAS